MTAKTKPVNYTPEQVADMVRVYTSATDDTERANAVNALADLYGKTPASIRAKLVREGVYIAKEYKTKKGGKPISKEQLVSLIAREVGSTVEQVESLAKATKPALARVLKTLMERNETVED